MARTTTNELTRPLYAAVGVTDRVVEIARGSVSDAQTRLVELQQGINKLEREPQALRARALEVPTKVQGFLEKHDVAYDQLVARGDDLVRRIRRQKSTQDAVKSARTTSSKAKTTTTQAKNAAKRTSTAPKRSAKATATTAGRTAKSAAKAGAQATKKVGD